MIEYLVQVGKNTYYIEDRSKIGVYQINETDIYLIDSGFANESGRKIYEIIKKKKWHLKGIITTHGHRDHTGGAAFLQEKTNCIIYDMVGVKTSDQVFFLGDSLLDESTLRYHYVTYLIDVKSQLRTLDYLEQLPDGYFIPSHTKPTKHLDHLIRINRQAITDIINTILDFCKTPKTFDLILQHIFERFSLRMNDLQYTNVGSTTRSYLAYLLNQGELETMVENNLYYWRTI